MTKSRSNEQNSLLWSLLTQVSEQLPWDGAQLSPDDWKHLFTASLRGYRIVRAIDAGHVVVLGMRTSKMTTDEMSNLIELIYAFGANHNVRFKELEN